MVIMDRWMDCVVLCVMYGTYGTISSAMPLTLVVLFIVCFWSITTENPFTWPHCTFLLYPCYNPVILSCISEALSKAIKWIHPTCDHQVNPSNVRNFAVWINALISENYSLWIWILAFFSAHHFVSFEYQIVSGSHLYLCPVLLHMTSICYSKLLNFHPRKQIHL